MKVNLASEVAGVTGVGVRRGVGFGVDVGAAGGSAVELLLAAYAGAQASTGRAAASAASLVRYRISRWSRSLRRAAREDAHRRTSARSAIVSLFFKRSRVRAADAAIVTETGPRDKIVAWQPIEPRLASSVSEASRSCAPCSSTS